LPARNYNYKISAHVKTILFRKARPDEIFLHNFLWMGEFSVTDKPFTIPLNYFNKLAEEMQQVGAKIIFPHNQGRCGGTLVTALFKESSRCVCFNEPTCISTICRQYVCLSDTAR